ncbi:MAG TPA: YdcF family protein [Rhizomicrobium sp.]|nr:YdcF family protein [Rhizomicrobium sp.]
MRSFSSLLVLAVLGYGAGLLLFANHVQKAAPLLHRADGIVALTGGELRVDRAAALLEKKLGKRLLITGVDLSATKADIKRLAHGKTRFDCCADLGFVAADTHGNAQETAEWAAEHGYKSLIVVTANYHMPRTLTEFSAAMPNVALQPFPVQPENLDFTHWWRHPHSLRLLNSEYAKFLASWTMNVVVWPLLQKADAEHTET